MAKNLDRRMHVNAARRPRARKRTPPASTEAGQRHTTVSGTIKSSTPTVSPAAALLGIKHVAILAIDIAGYGRLMENDEVGTHLTIRQHRQELIDAEIVSHGGRIIKFTGDGMLIEFADAGAALRAALRTQHYMQVRNRGRNSVTQVNYRMGIHAGAVILDSGDVFGIDVIIAARLEQIAPPGGLCFSRTIYERATPTLRPFLTSFGHPLLKNIERSVEVFTIEPGQLRNIPLPPRPRSRTLSAGKVAAPAKRHSCSIAVLSFDNVGLHRRNAYFSDGLVSDVVDALSMFPSLFVVSTRSSFTYRGRDVPLDQIARELGVRYLVTGSVRTHAAQLRVSARLIDTTDGRQLWARHFDGAVANVFQLQAEIAQRIILSVEPKVRAEEVTRASHKPPASLDAYDCLLRVVALRETFTRTAYSRIAALLDRALALDPGYALAMAHKAMCRCIQRDRGWRVSGVNAKEDALALAARAVELAPDDPAVLCLSGHTIAIVSHDNETGLRLLHRALDLNPNYAEAWTRKAWIHAYRDELAIAVDHADRALELSPLDPQIVFALGAATAASFFLTNYEHALAYARRALALPRVPFWIYVFAIACCDGLARDSDIAVLRREFEVKWPGFDVYEWLDEKSPWTLAHHVAALRHALDNAGFGSRLVSVA